MAKKISQGLAVAALILNILVIPGLGTIIAGRTRTGVWQLVGFVVGIPLALLLVGIPLMFAMWVWGIVTGVQLVQESQ